HGGAGAMQTYVQCSVDAQTYHEATIPAPPAIAATQQGKSSKHSKNSTEVPPLSHSSTPENIVQSMADVPRGDLHDSDRSLATFATPATQEEKRSERSESRTGIPPRLPCSMSEEKAQRRAEITQEDLHHGDRGLATFAIPATQERQSSKHSKNSRGHP